MEDAMKSKTKLVKRTRKPLPKKVVRQKSSTAKRAQPKNSLSQQQTAILKRVWPRISKSTKFARLPAGQSIVSYALPSGERTAATLMWYTFTHGPRVYGHYDDASDVCYVGEIIEQVGHQ
jgi:hypothetical protein